MRFVRTILALAIAVSLAVLPIGASAAGLVMASGDAHSSMHMSMQMGASSDMSMDDCCPNDVNGAPSHTDGDKCGMGLCCVGGSIALGDIRAVDFTFLPAAGRKLAIPADRTVSVRSGSPPYRPPRV